MNDKDKFRKVVKFSITWIICFFVIGLLIVAFSPSEENGKIKQNRPVLVAWVIVPSVFSYFRVKNKKKVKKKKHQPINFRLETRNTKLEVKAPAVSVEVSDVDTTDQDMSGYTIHYIDGRVVGSSPKIKGSYYDHRDIINGANFIISDGKNYDLTSIGSIMQTLPQFTIPARTWLKRIFGKLKKSAGTWGLTLWRWEIATPSVRSVPSIASGYTV